ncbi:50S ribosomal protein L23 [bacterium BMS3Abin03]|nr:50S ribosomal protein L23 [bacterium BMS3Abin03]HDZ58586.1 50S ribosomal protein L23 [Ignavibacteriales bacterium]
MHQILIRPLITEKMSDITVEQNKYGFIVNPRANKIQIAKAVSEKFEVHVIDVKTLNHQGKTKTQFRKSGRYTGKTAKFKKAIVTLKKGEKIDIFEEV